MIKRLLTIALLPVLLYACNSKPTMRNDLVADTPTETKAEGTCSGDKHCTACKNCKYCKNCSKNGGTCGVCK